MAEHAHHLDRDPDDCKHNEDQESSDELFDLKAKRHCANPKSK